MCPKTKSSPPVAASPRTRVSPVTVSDGSHALTCADCNFRPSTNLLSSFFNTWMDSVRIMFQVACWNRIAQANGAQCVCRMGRLENPSLTGLSKMGIVFVHKVGDWS